MWSPDQTGYGQVDIALGNVVGSNIFNILSVLGLSASFAPGDLSVVSAMLSFDIPMKGGFVLPLLAVTLVVLALRHWRSVHAGNRN